MKALTFLDTPDINGQHIQIHSKEGAEIINFITTIKPDLKEFINNSNLYANEKYRKAIITLFDSFVFEFICVYPLRNNNVILCRFGEFYLTIIFDWRKPGSKFHYLSGSAYMKIVENNEILMIKKNSRIWKKTFAFKHFWEKNEYLKNKN